MPPLLTSWRCKVTEEEEEHTVVEDEGKEGEEDEGEEKKKEEEKGRLAYAVEEKETEWSQVRCYNQIETNINTILTSTTPILPVFPCDTRGRPNADDEEEEKRPTLKEKEGERKEEEKERLAYAVDEEETE